MRQAARFPSVVLSCASIFVLFALATHAVANGADELVLREGLAIPPVGRAGRSPIHQDAIEAEIVAGKWSAPQPGDEVKLPDDSTRMWQPIRAGEDGWFRGPALGGGYVHFAVTVESEQVMVLDAAGHDIVYVNGEPRTGDLYSNGWVHLPVRLRAGKNDFLFHVARGQLRAKLVPPKAAAQFDLADTTLPNLIVGEAVDCETAVVVVNATNERAEQLAIEATLPGGEPRRTSLPPLLPLSTRKLGVRLTAAAPEAEGDREVQLKLLARKQDEWDTLDESSIKLRIVRPDATHKRTFRSDIDGSVQYYAVVPRQGSGFGVRGSGEREPRSEVQDQSEQRPGLVLTLHGAGVEALGQAQAYAAKPDLHIVAATNRRPFGFDWEDWGRLDAIEVLERAQKHLGTDPRRTYLTGHSMGGHGVWHVGVTFPDRFAAIGPSAGWVSMFSYAGARRGQAEGDDSPNAKIGELLNRCMAPSDTLALSRNFLQHGVYVLHGEKDDNVPVNQARTMRQQLAGFHPDFVYHEEPGQGHWWGKDLSAFSRDGASWGTACVDWPPMFEFFAQHQLADDADTRHVEFVTASPGVSARSHWVTIEAQTDQFKPSSVSIDHDAKARKFSGKTENVARLALDVGHLPPGEPIHVELDGEKLADVAWPEVAAGNDEGRSSNADRSRRAGVEGSTKTAARIWLNRADSKWLIAAKPAPSLKGPHRSGPFKDAFRNHVLFVYGTHGTPDENAWSFAKARYDAETFWYRGNGSVDVWSDTEVKAECASRPLNPNDRDPFSDRNVIVYGNADTNSAWQALLAESPVQVRRSRVQIGDRVELGEDLGCLFVRPRPLSDRALVGVVAGSGVVGMRLTDRLPYFVSGVAYPDCIVFDSEVLAKGIAGVHAAGFFGIDWSVASGEFSWRD